MPEKPSTDGSSGAGKLSAVRDFFALERDVAVLVGAVLIIGMGEQLWTPFVGKYLRVLGASVFVVGLFDTLEALLDAVSAPS